MNSWMDVLDPTTHEEVPPSKGGPHERVPEARRRHTQSKCVDRVPPGMCRRHMIRNRNHLTVNGRESGTTYGKHCRRCRHAGN